MRNLACILALGGLLALIPLRASAAPVVYSDRSAFQWSLGFGIVDPYAVANYGLDLEIYSDAEMSAIVGETTYRSTGFSSLHILNGVGDDRVYCAGCNGSFLLTFTSTSLGDANGVYGVGFDYWNSPSFANGDPYHAFVTFGDGATSSWMLDVVDTPGTPSGFFGLTDTRHIRSIHIGRADGSADTRGNVGLDNLTIGSEPFDVTPPVPVPEPATLLLVGLGGLGGALARARRRRA